MLTSNGNEKMTISNKSYVLSDDDDHEQQKVMDDGNYAFVSDNSLSGNDVRVFEQ